MRKSRRRRNARMENSILAGLAIFLIVFVFMNIQNKRLSVDPATYQPLLNLIADVESRGNYNAYYGNAHNSKVDFTNMSIAEVMQWQKKYVSQGSPSSAVGRYQIIDSTLSGLVKELKVDTKEQFDKDMQDKMAIELLERRGSEAYINNEMTQQEFAASLAKEWASLPKVVGKHPNKSYYAGDGLNKALVNKDKVLSAIELIEPAQ